LIVIDIAEKRGLCVGGFLQRGKSEGGRPLVFSLLSFWRYICIFVCPDGKNFTTPCNPISSAMKKALKITALILVILMAIAFAIPIIFKKQIAELVKKEINKSLTAKVDFSDVSLSLFRHFPKVSITLDDLSVIGTNEFAKDTLIAASSVDASVNLLSVIKGKDIKVSGVFLQSPRIHALVNKEGKANWDIAKEDTASTPSSDTSASAFKMTLQKYEIKDGYIFYKDETGNMSAEISGLDHEGSGDFTEDEFTLSTSTKADATSFIYEAIPYLANTKTSVKADIKIDSKTNTYTLKQMILL